MKRESGGIELTNITTSEAFPNWPNHIVAHNIANNTDMLHGKRMLIHEGVHGREDIRWCFGRECSHERCLVEIVHYDMDGINGGSTHRKIVT